VPALLPAPGLRGRQRGPHRDGGALGGPAASPTEHSQRLSRSRPRARERARNGARAGIRCGATRLGSGLIERMGKITAGDPIAEEEAQKRLTVGGVKLPLKGGVLVDLRSHVRHAAQVTFV